MSAYFAQPQRTALPPAGLAALKDALYRPRQASPARFGGRPVSRARAGRARRRGCFPDASRAVPGEARPARKARVVG
jgi:hypothetical protein